MKYKYLAATILASSALLGSCIDEFADINTNPGDITKPDARYLFTECLSNFEPADYGAWYYDFQYISYWGQTLAPSSGNTDMLNFITEQGNVGSQIYRYLRMAKDLRYFIDRNLGEEEKAAAQNIKAMTYPLGVYLCMLDTDMYGSMAYIEADEARYTNPPLLTPKYDTQEELFEVWLKELDETITTLSKNHEVKQTTLGAQDFIYKGDISKWLKLANSLKLKIAARLYNTDKERAIMIVNEAAASSAGFLSSNEDDLIYNRGRYDNHWNNEITVGVGSKQLIDFMINNRDPRVRVIFSKNEFNSNVVQAYFDQKKNLPFYIAQNVEYEEVSGRKVFKGWKAPGEPWVRYYGVPLEVNAKVNNDYKDYFDPQGTMFHLLTKEGAKKEYTPKSFINREVIKGNFDYTYPDAPDTEVIQDKEDYGWFGNYFSAGEVSLYLAEFKLLGANLPKSAQDYLTDGITMSVKSYDNIAALNHIPYYDQTYINDKFDKSIKLVAGEIETMLDHSVYKLNGSLKENLEKIYLQQYIHQIMSPVDMFVTVRRSGVPMKDSNIYPYQTFYKALGESYKIPRRFRINEPTPSDIMKDIIMGAIKEQGFTYGNDPVKLSSERIWYDKNAPEFGTGPKQ